jgi:hypothetical protein
MQGWLLSLQGALLQGLTCIQSVQLLQLSHICSAAALCLAEHMPCCCQCFQPTVAGGTNGTCTACPDNLMTGTEGAESQDACSECLACLLLHMVFMCQSATVHD